MARAQRQVAVQRAADLHAAFTRLEAASRHPITPGDLALECHLPSKAVYRALHHAPWWTADHKKAAHLETIRRLQVRHRRLGFPGIAAMRRAPHPPVRRKLDEGAVAHIRERLVAGDKPTTLARTLGVSYSTIRDIQSGRRWRSAESKPQEGSELYVQVAWSAHEPRGILLLSPALWKLLGSPQRVSLIRQYDHALVLLPDDDGTSVLDTDAERPSITLERATFLAVGLAPGSYTCLASLSKQRATINDFPVEKQMISVFDACNLLHCRRQNLYALIKRGVFRAYFDGRAKRLVLPLEAVWARLAEKTKRAEQP